MRTRCVVFGWMAVVAACGEVANKQKQSDAMVDDVAVVNEDAPTDAPARVPFGTVELVTELATPDSQDPELTDDGLVLVFVSDRPNGLGASDIWIATRSSATGPFTNITALADVNSPASEQHPYLSPDGRRMYFASSRTGSQGVDIYVTARADRTTPWSMPTRVDALSSAANEQRVSLTADELVAVIDSDRDGARQIYMATRSTTGSAWTIPTLIGITGNNAAISRDGLALYYSSGSPTNLYVARRADRTSAFANPIELTEINSAQLDGDAWISPDEATIYFSSTRGGAEYQIHRASR